MITKYKLSDLARDLKLPANDIIDCLAGRYGAKKRPPCSRLRR